MDVAIRYGIVINRHGRSGGWMPVIWVNGVCFGDTYGVGKGQDEAFREAEKMARDEAAKFRGDWNVTIAPSPEPAPKGATK